MPQRYDISAEYKNIFHIYAIKKFYVHFLLFYTDMFRTFATTKNQNRMEEYGDWLYLIIIIIAGISSLIGATNKKNKEAAERKKSREIITEKEDDWENKESYDDAWYDDTRHDDREIPQSVLPERQPTYVERQAIVTPDIHTPHIPSNNSQFYETQKKDYSMFKKEIEHTPPFALYAEDDNIPITLEDLPENTDEWRKAFVYNEIFKHKY